MNIYFSFILFNFFFYFNILDLGFTDIDDYILINMRHSEFYNKLVINKGIENIEKRSAFLNLNE